MERESFKLYAYKNELYAIKKLSSVTTAGIHLTGPNPNVLHEFWILASKFYEADWIYAYFKSAYKIYLETDELYDDVIFLGEKIFSYDTVNLYDSHDRYHRSLTV